MNTIHPNELTVQRQCTPMPMVKIQSCAKKKKIEKLERDKNMQNEKTMQKFIRKHLLPLTAAPFPNELKVQRTYTIHMFHIFQPILYLYGFKPFILCINENSNTVKIPNDVIRANRITRTYAHTYTRTSTAMSTRNILYTRTKLIDLIDA